MWVRGAKVEGGRVLAGVNSILAVKTGERELHMRGAATKGAAQRRLGI